MGLSPLRPIAWQREHCLAAISEPRSITETCAAAGAVSMNTPRPAATANPARMVEGPRLLHLRCTIPLARRAGFDRNQTGITARSF
jgi:hypothetical protein